MTGTHSYNLSAIYIHVYDCNFGPNESLECIANLNDTNTKCRKRYTLKILMAHIQHFFTKKT